MSRAFLRRIGQLFDPRGRLSPLEYRGAFLRTLLAGTGFACFAIWLAGQGGREIAILFLLGSVLATASLLAATIRRLHDRDRSGRWLAVYGAVLAVSFAPVEKAADAYPVTVIALVGGILGFTGWFFVETFLRVGTPGANRFGPSPAP